MSDFRSWPSEKFAEDLVLFLRSRTMPGLPHIGVLGPDPDEAMIDNSPVDVDDTDSYSSENVGEVEDEELDWNFVPNKMEYQLSIKPTSENINETKIDFYIRISEGCDGDVGKDLAILGRDPRYILSEKQLQKVFRHYELWIITGKDASSTSLRLVVDEVEQDLLPTQYTITDNIVEVILNDKSDPFLNYERGKPILVAQKYKIKIRKEITDKDDDSRVIFVQIKNESNKTKRSTLPKLKAGQTEEECRNSYKIIGKNKNSDLEKNPLWPNWRPLLYKEEDRTNNPEGNRYGYLMEFSSSESLSSYDEPIKLRDMARITNAVFDDSKLIRENNHIHGEITFRDHANFKEEVPKMRPGSPPTIFLQRLGISKELAETLQYDLQYDNLNKFQEDAIDNIYESYKRKDKKTVLISARTAGGKTEAFAIPILDHCITTPQIGVKAIIFYPTKALANDQASRFIKILYHLNKRLGGRKITLGILHGDIAKNEESLHDTDVSGLPFQCPKCSSGLLQPITSEQLICDNVECKIKLDFVWAHTRTTIYSKPPDILITNPDTLVWDIMLRPDHHSIFGRSVYACQECGLTYAPSGRKNKCHNKDCRLGLEKINPVSPSFIVFDEVHLFKGSFGINCSYLLSRIEHIISEYSKEYHSDADHKIICIGSTATISNDREFVMKFFNVKEGEFKLVPSEKDKINEYYILNEHDKTIKRHHVFVMPYAYTSDSTVGMSIYYLQARAMQGKPSTRFLPNNDPLNKYLQILTFVNAIKTSNSLIAQTRRSVSTELSDLQIDGHTTDFDKSQRSTVERKFNTHDLHVVFATSTLEVGVDFRTVDCVIINGFPYSFNDYLQRIGRGGRRNDSLIITVCQNWKPVDHYYYAHGRSALYNQQVNIEPVPITRENSEAIKKHLQGALLDFIVRKKDLKGYDLDDIRTLSTIDTARSEINEDVIAACRIPKSLENDAITYLDEFVYFLSQLSKTAGASGKSKVLYSRFLTDINPLYNLSSLRSTDPEVTMEVFWNK